MGLQLPGPRCKLFAGFFSLSLLLTTNVCPLPGQTNPLAARVSQFNFSSLSLLQLFVRGPFVPSAGLPQEERNALEMGLGSGRQASSVLGSVLLYRLRMGCPC